MNRIILIGNGFDLAHQMKTSYGHFINNYWNRLVIKLKENFIAQKYEDENIFIDRVPNQWLSENDFNSLSESLKFSRETLKFKNKFLQILTKSAIELNWVDIENEYYSLLKNSYQNPDKNYSIKDLNKDFLLVQNLLEDYLSDVEKEFINSFPKTSEDLRLRRNIIDAIYSDFNLRDFSESSINKLTEQEFQRIYKTLNDLREEQITFEELELNERDKKLYSSLWHSKDVRKDIRKLLTSSASTIFFRFRPKEILFLNFNYTSTEYEYKDAPQDDEFKERIQIDINHIHGVLKNRTDNKIIFGFGDEIDENYKNIEKLNDNDYLQNIKSIKYLESESYKSLLEFINSDDYQIYLFGHSCGVSDRTLLNTLFENNNCCSIKPYYRQIDESKDNYTEIIKNISRNFTNKTSMRDKVVNKIYTKPLFK